MSKDQEKFFTTGKPCKRGHTGPRLVSNGTCIECAALWKSSNKSKVLQQSRASYAKHNASRNEASKARRKLIQAETPWVMLIRWSKSKAKKRGIAFSLTAEWGESNWTGRCAITGMPFAMNHGLAHAHPMSPSIDRIDSNGSYEESNCRFVLHCVNVFRSTLNDAQMVEVASAIARLAGGIPCH